MEMALIINELFKQMLAMHGLPAEWEFAVTRSSQGPFVRFQPFSLAFVTATAIERLVTWMLVGGTFAYQITGTKN